MKNIWVAVALGLGISTSAYSAEKYDLTCTVKENCKHANDGDLGYCVVALQVSNQGATVERKKLQGEVLMSPLRLNEVFEKVQGDRVIELIVSDEILHQGDDILVGENLVHLHRRSSQPLEFSGTLNLEEDFSFEVACRSP